MVFGLSRCLSHRRHYHHATRLDLDATQGEEQYNWTSHRQRGYGVGSLNQGPNDPDKYWKQPGHPLNKETKGGRFEVGGCGIGGWADGFGRGVLYVWSLGGEAAARVSIALTLHASPQPLYTNTQGLKGYESWDPSDPDGKKTAKPIRSLDEN